MSKYGVISGPYFPVFALNTGKCGPEINPYLDILHALYMQKDKINYPASIIWEANLHLLSKIGAIEKSFNSINSRTAVNRQFLYRQLSFVLLTRIHKTLNSTLSY